MITYEAEQGTAEWLEARRGVITGSRAKDARDFKRDGQSSEKRIGYAADLAREREGGMSAEAYQTYAMRKGQEEEQFADIAYIALTGAETAPAYFVSTEDRKFGVSLDRRIVGRNAATEIKTMVSSQTLFRAMVEGDISEFKDQCEFAIWLLRLDYIDLCLWAPDLNYLHVIRIHRDEEAVQRMEDDMLAFDALVESYRAKLRARLTGPAMRDYQAEQSDDGASPFAVDKKRAAKATPAAAKAPTPTKTPTPAAKPAATAAVPADLVPSFF